MKSSSAVEVITPSLTRELFNLAQGYDDVIDLTLGDPDIQPDDNIKRAACDAILKEKTRYSANAGLLEFRQAIAQQFSREYGLQVAPEKNVIVTVGGMEALYLSLRCILDKGDEVIIPGPYYVNYIQMVRSCGGVPIIVNTTEDSGFTVTSEQIEKVITPRTTALILNSPCNPSGRVIGCEVLAQIAELANRHDFAVVSDEVYRTLVFNGRPYKSIASFPGMMERTIVVDSLSKRFAMTGYRVGYAIGSERIIADMTKLQENVAACAALPSQYAGIAAYRCCANDHRITEIFKRRCRSMCCKINQIDKLFCPEPEATFYLFINISRTGMDSVAFAHELLEKQHVAVVPGVAYGSHYDDHIRIACTLEEEKLLEACGRIKRFVDSIV